MRKCSEMSIGLLQLSCYHLSGPTKVNNFDNVIRFCEYNSWRLNITLNITLVTTNIVCFKDQYYKNKASQRILHPFFVVNSN